LQIKTLKKTATESFLNDPDLTAQMKLSNIQVPADIEARVERLVDPAGVDVQFISSLHIDQIQQISTNSDASSKCLVIYQRFRHLIV
jgi:hypothetical protein